MAKRMSFEDAMERLGEIVARLEEGNVPLEESMKLYEEGMRLGKLCRGILKAAEDRIKLLTEECGAESENDEE